MELSKGKIIHISDIDNDNDIDLFSLNYIALVNNASYVLQNSKYNDMHNTVPLRQVVPLSPVYTQ